jgi:hypothetical protein
MDDFWQGVFTNKALWVTLLSWFIAQSCKIIRGLSQGKKFNFYWILRTGGMPSAHSAAVVALAFSVGKELGYSSGMFALATIFALITMFDAQTWRRSIGVQASILNRILEDIKNRRKIEDYKLKELVGHTPVEVFVGALVGLAVFLLFY